MTRPCFDLVREPWIPCLLPSGAERALGLREALAAAPDLAEVFDPSPPITVALHRLLLAVLQRALGPCDEASWVRWWRAGSWPVAPLEEYLAAWSARLDLFHPRHPFCQVADLPPKLLAPVSRLAQELSSGFRATLFDHTLDDTAAAVPPAAAARLLVAYQSFCLSGRLGDETGLASVRGGSLAHAAVFLATGGNLFETLMLNLLPVGLLPSGDGPDLPAWERPEPVAHATRAPGGYLDALTWQSRRVCLFPETGTDGRLVVRRVAASGGWEMPRGEELSDPMLAYRPAAPGPDGRPRWRPMPLPEAGGWWQSRAALLTRWREDLRAPAALMWVGELVACGVLAPDYACALSVFGVRGEKARIDAWAHHRQALPVRYLEDADLAADLERCLGMAADVAAALEKALAPVRPGGTGDYWQRLRRDLHRLLGDLPGDLGHREAVLLWWAETCAHAAWQAFQRASRHQPLDSRALRPIVQSRQLLARELHGRVLKPYGGGRRR